MERNQKVNNNWSSGQGMRGDWSQFAGEMGSQTNTQIKFPRYF